MNTSTDFDSGGGVATTVDETNNHIDLTLEDDGGYSYGYFHFRLDNASGIDVSFEITNLDDDRMPDSYRLVYTTDLDNLDWSRMDEQVGGGFSQTFNSDGVYIASWHAYPYGHTVDLVNNLESDYPDLVETEVIGQSHEGRDMHAIRISDPDVPDGDKQHAVSITRQHPGETQGSYHMEAGIEFVIDELQNGGFDEDLLWHFIPCANPDGVYHGIHRADTQGYDFNREWDSETPVEISNMKGYIRDNVGEPFFGFDHHASTQSSYVGAFYEVTAATTGDIAKASLVDDANLSYSGITGTAYTSRARSFYYEETGGTMITTEVGTYHDYSVASLKNEGQGMYEAAVSSIPHEFLTASDQLLTYGGKLIRTAQ